MTFLNDLWKKFKDTQTGSDLTEKDAGSDTVVLEKFLDPFKKSNQTTGRAASAQPFPVEALTESLKRAKSVLNALQHPEEEYQEIKTPLNISDELNPVISPLEEEKVGLRFTTIKQSLGATQWKEEENASEEQPIEIYCPKCQSNHLKQLPQTSLHSPHTHRYRCLNCGTEFNDDSDSPIERGVPPLNLWMHCWYLMGSSDSLSYIASQLGLDLAVVKIMVDQLKKTFNIQQPLTQFIGYEEWSKQSQNLRVQLKEDLLRNYERLNANIATVPKDTAEHRRQLNLRRDLTSTTAPPSSKGPRR